MLDQILKNDLERSFASNQPILRDDFDYGNLLDQSKLAAKEWGALSKEAQKEIGSLNAFYASKGLRDLKDPHLSPCRNLYLIRKEI